MPRGKQTRKTRRGTQRDETPVDVDAERAAKRQRILADLRRRCGMQNVTEELIRSKIGWSFCERLIDDGYIQAVILPLVHQAGQTQLTFEQLLQRPLLQVIQYLLKNLLLPRLNLQVGYEHVRVDDAVHVLHPTVSGETGFDAVRTLVEQPESTCTRVGLCLQGMQRLEQLPIKMIQQSHEKWKNLTIQELAKRAAASKLPIHSIVYRTAFYTAISPVAGPFASVLERIARIDNWEGVGFEVVRCLSHDSAGARRHVVVKQATFTTSLASIYVTQVLLPFLGQLPAYANTTTMEQLTLLKDASRGLVGVALAMQLIAEKLFLPILKQYTAFSELEVSNMHSFRHALHKELFWFEALRRTLQDKRRVPFLNEGELCNDRLPDVYTIRRQAEGCSAINRLIERVRYM